MYDEPGARTSPQRIRHWLDPACAKRHPGRRWTLSGIRETCSLPSYVLRMLIQGCTLTLHHSHTRPFTDIPAGYVMRSRGGGHALLGSTDWAVAVRPCMYACMCPATLAHSRLMHACLTLTLTCGSDYSDGVAPMPHACCTDSITQTQSSPNPCPCILHCGSYTAVCKRGLLDHSDLDI